jgi:hypothetical protein
LEPQLPKEVANDRHLALEKGERGERARRRLRTAVYRVSTVHDVVVRRHRAGDKLPGQEGYRLSPHWRRGHWKMQAYGEGLSLRRRILIAPYPVNQPGGSTPGDVTAYHDRR